MKKKVKYRPGITVLAILSIVALTISIIFFTGAIQFIKTGKAGGIVGGLLALVAFTLFIGVGALISLINLPFCITSVKQSENKTYPIIILIIESIIIIIAVILLIILIANRN